MVYTFQLFTAVFNNKRQETRKRGPVPAQTVNGCEAWHIQYSVSIGTKGELCFLQLLNPLHLLLHLS